MIELFLVSITSVDWAKYLSTCEAVLGRCISDTFDQSRWEKDVASFVVSICDFNKEDGTALELLEGAGNKLNHVSVGMLLITQTEILYEIMENCSFHITTTSSLRKGLKLALLTGTLLDWKQAMQDCAKSASVDLNIFSRKGLAILEKTRSLKGS